MEERLELLAVLCTQLVGQFLKRQMRLSRSKNNNNMVLLRFIITVIILFFSKMCYSQKDSVSLYYGETIHNHSFTYSAIHGYAMAYFYGNDSLKLFVSSNGLFGHQNDRWFPYYKKNLLSFKYIKKEDNYAISLIPIIRNTTWKVSSSRNKGKKITISVQNHENQKIFYDLLLITEKDTTQLSYIYGNHSIRIKYKLKQIVIYPVISSCNFDSTISFDMIDSYNNFIFTICDSSVCFYPDYLRVYKNSDILMPINGVDFIYLIERKSWELAVPKLLPLFEFDRVIINKNTSNIYENYFKNNNNHTD